MDARPRRALPLLAAALALIATGCSGPSDSGDADAASDGGEASSPSATASADPTADSTPSSPATSVTSTDVHLTAVDDTWSLHPATVAAGEPCMRLDGSGNTVAAQDTALGPPFFECGGLKNASSTCMLLEGSTIACPASHTAKSAYTYEAPAAVAAGLEVPRDPNRPGVRPFAIVLEDGTLCMRGLTYQQGGLGWAETGYPCTPEDPAVEDMRLFLKTTPYDRLAQHPRWTLRQEGEVYWATVTSDADITMEQELAVREIVYLGLPGTKVPDPCMQGVFAMCDE